MTLDDKPRCLWCGHDLIPGLNTDFCTQKCEIAWWDRADAEYDARVEAYEEPEEEETP